MADGLTEILTLKKQDGTKVYPRTVTDAIIDKEGRYLTDLIGDLKSIQLEDHDIVGVVNEKVKIMEVQLSHKVDSIEGMGLSSNDFTDEYKNKIDGLRSVEEMQLDISNKVDKIEGKGLSENDFTTIFRIKLENLPNRATLDEMFNEKVNKVPGKGLSTNDYTDADRNRLWNDVYDKSQTRIYVEDSLKTKVDKEEGKQLSDENFTLEMRQKLASIEPNANKYDDTYIRDKLNNKVDKVYGKELSANDFTDKLKEKLENLPSGETLNQSISNITNSIVEEIIRAKAAEKANAALIEGLSGRMDTAEGAITQAQVDIQGLQDTINANAEADGQLKGRMDALEDVVGKDAEGETAATGLFAEIAALKAKDQAHEAKDAELEAAIGVPEAEGQTATGIYAHIKELHEGVAQTFATIKTEIKEDGKLYTSVADTELQTVTDVAVMDQDDIDAVLAGILGEEEQPTE